MPALSLLSAAGVDTTFGQHGLAVDTFGDLMSVMNIPGDSFRHRHDKVKTVLNRFCLASNIRAECEVFGAFRDLIPVHALEEQDDLQRGRGRQGLLPDFSMELPTPLGQSASQLAGVVKIKKFIVIVNLSK